MRVGVCEWLRVYWVWLTLWVSVWVWPTLWQWVRVILHCESECDLLCKNECDLLCDSEYECDLLCECEWVWLTLWEWVRHGGVHGRAAVAGGDGALRTGGAGRVLGLVRRRRGVCYNTQTRHHDTNINMQTRHGHHDTNINTGMDCKCVVTFCGQLYT